MKEERVKVNGDLMDDIQQILNQVKAQQDQLAEAGNRQIALLLNGYIIGQGLPKGCSFDLEKGEIILPAQGNPFENGVKAEIAEI